MRVWLTRIRPGVIAVAAIALFIAGDAYFGAADLIKGPQIIVESPITGAVLETPVITVTGQAKRIATLFMNGRQIFTDQAGQFKEPLLLAYGYNIIELVARDKFGRTTEQKLELVFK